MCIIQVKLNNFIADFLNLFHDARNVIYVLISYNAVFSYLVTEKLLKEGQLDTEVREAE